MDAIIPLGLILALAIFLVIVIRDKKILKEQNRLYQGFVKNTSFKEFVSILETTSLKTIDQPMRLMLRKYLAKAFTSINFHLVPKMLSDIRNSKHAEVLHKELSVAIVELGNILGLSLVMADKDGAEAICYFIDGFLPDEVRKIQYEIASNQLEEKLILRYYDHPLDFKKEIKDRIMEFSEKAK